jgi:molecular chaperone GrpE (heat shock protein)
MTDAMDIDAMDIEEPINEIVRKFELQKKEIAKLKAQIKQLEDDYMEAAAERDDALERLHVYEPEE